MSKDPAFLFYHQDFFTGVSDMTNEEAGAYIRCMCIQASKNGISEKHMTIICQSQEVHNTIKSKFVLNPETNLFENLRLKIEIEKRKKYSESRSNNRKKAFIDVSKQSIKSKSYDKHMENENENENEIEDEKKKNKDEKIDFEQIKNIFNSVCNNLPQVQKISKSRESLIRNRIKENNLEALGKVFQNTANSNFLNGENKNGWKADFDWVLNPNNFIKILEGNYENKNPIKKEEEKKVGRMTETAFKNTINAFL